MIWESEDPGWSFWFPAYLDKSLTLSSEKKKIMTPALHAGGRGIRIQDKKDEKVLADLSSERTEKS